MASDTQLAAFGKLPIKGDFIRVGHVAELTELDAWLQEGIHRSQQMMGGEWNDAFDALPPQRFLFQGSGRLLAGVFCASQDRAGRRYPFLVVARLAALPAGVRDADLPLALEGFFVGAEMLVGADLDVGVLGERIAQLPATPVVDAATARQGARDSEPVAGVWAAAMPGGDIARRARLLAELHGLVVTRPPAKLLVHVPVAGAMHVGFWLDVLDHWMAGARPTFLSWPATAGRLRIVADRLQGRYFESFCWPERDSDHGYDLAHAGAAAGTPADIYQTAAMVDGSMADMLAALGAPSAQGGR